MASANTNRKLAKAKAAKFDGFFTRRQDIEAELRFHRDEFQGKTVYCNCDDPRESEFVQYFCRNFELLGLKKLVATREQEPQARRRPHDRERGRQRTLAILEYMDGAFSTNFNGDIISYGNIRDKTRGEKFRSYEMQVYVCSGGVAGAAAPPSRPATAPQKPPHQPPTTPRALGRHPGRLQLTSPATAAQASPCGCRACVDAADGTRHR